MQTGRPDATTVSGCDPRAGAVILSAVARLAGAALALAGIGGAPG